MLHEKGQSMAELWSTAQVAHYFGVGDQTVLAWRKAGTLHGTKVGRKLFFDPAHIKAVGTSGHPVAKVNKEGTE
jgi:excisionase family DNA binding protein